MVICVIALHCAMTYMDYRPAWWYVQDSQQQIGFTYLVIILDYFPMTALFFLAGYFAPPSFAKRGISSFIKDKFLHIGIPWILGVLFVAPFFSRASFVALGYPSLPIFDYFKEYFFSSLYQQAHYWFLGVLFLFFVVYAFLPKRKNQTTTKTNSAISLVITTFLITAITYYLSSKYYKPVSDWTNLGYVLYFQPARFVGYAAMFILGAYGNKQKWFTQEGWKPNVAYLIIGIFGAIWLIYWKFALAANYSIETNFIVDALTYSLVSICMTFGLISIALKENSENTKYSLSQIAPYSYGIYWLHQIVAILIMNYLISYDISALSKWIVTMVSTIIVCTLLAKYGLKKIPLLRNIF